MTVTACVRVISAALLLVGLAACATPAAQVDETRTPRPILDAKSQLESGRR